MSFIVSNCKELSCSVCHHLFYSPLFSSLVSSHLIILHLICTLSPTLPCSALLYTALLSPTLPCSALYCSALPYPALLYSALLYTALPWRFQFQNKFNSSHFSFLSFYFLVLQNVKIATWLYFVSLPALIRLLSCNLHAACRCVGMVVGMCVSQAISTDTYGHPIPCYISPFSFFITGLYCTALHCHHIISYHAVSYHAVSYHAVSYHAVSYHIISYLD